MYTIVWQWGALLSEPNLNELSIHFPLGFEPMFQMLAELNQWLKALKMLSITTTGQEVEWRKPIVREWNLPVLNESTNEQ